MASKRTPKPTAKAAKGKVAPKKVTKKAISKPKPKSKSKKAALSKTAQVGSGRPSGYTLELGLAVCGWIRQGYTLRQIGGLPNMPSKATIIRWLGNFPVFCDQYAHAREVQAFVMEDEIQEIADDSRNDWVEREGKDGAVEIVFNQENVARARVRIDSRKWLMAKMAPKRYGDRIAVTGKDGGPLQVSQTVNDVLGTIDGAGTGLPNKRTDDDHSK